MTTLWILNRINKGNKSCITDDIVTKLNVHSCVISIIVLSFIKFYYMVAYLLLYLLNSKQFKSNNLYEGVSKSFEPQAFSPFR